MAKSQHIGPRKKKPGPIIIDERPVPEPVLPPGFDPAKANAPVRTINFVEIGDMVGPQIQLILQRLNATHDTAKGGIHYFLPVRHGKIGSDIVFEEEFLSVVDQVCEIVDENGKQIKNAKIKLKGGAKEVMIIRQQI